MQILITGGAGFIGSHLAEYHLTKGDTVHVLDDLSSGSQSNIDRFASHPNFHFNHADILAWSDMDKVVVKMDRIYHLAAIVGVYKVLKDPERVLSVNILGTEKLLRAIKTSSSTAKILIASSSEVYGSPIAQRLSEDSNLTIEAMAWNRWYYAMSKLTDEFFSLAFHRKFNLPIIIVRLFNTIGPRQIGRYGMVVPRFIKQAVNHEPITVFGDGTQTRSFCDVRDTVVMLDKLCDNPDSYGQIINVGNDREITINNLALLIKKLAKSISRIEYVPYEQAYEEKYVDIKRRRPDLTKLFSYIDFAHQWTLEGSINDLLERIRE